MYLDPVTHSVGFVAAFDSLRERLSSLRNGPS